MKVCAILLVALLLLSGCGLKEFQAVGSLEEISNKEEIEKKQSWVKQGGGTAARASAGAFAAVFLFGLAGLPAAAIIASIPDQEDINMVELADKTAATACELDENSGVIYADGPGTNYGVIGLTGDKADPATGTRAVVLLYFWDKDYVSRLYGEVMQVKKIDDSNFSAWRMPMLKKNARGELVYAFDEKMRLKDNPTMLRDKSTLLLTFLNEGNGQEVTRDVKGILAEANEYYRKGGYALVPLRCAAGDKVCAMVKVKSE